MAKTRNRAKQDLAIAELAKGATLTETAAKLDISRQVLHNWSAEDPDYLARLEAERERVRAGYTRLLARGVQRAAELLEDADGKTALGALKLINERGLGPANAPTVQITHNSVTITPEQRAAVSQLDADQLKYLLQEDNETE